MAAAACLHLAQNWRALKSHWRDRRVFLVLAPIALVVAISVSAAQNGHAGVNPRVVMRHPASASAINVAQTFGTDVNRVFAVTKADGMHAQDAQQSLREIATSNGKPVGAVLEYFVK